MVKRAAAVMVTEIQTILSTEKIKPKSKTIRVATANRAAMYLRWRFECQFFIFFNLG